MSSPWTLLIIDDCAEDREVYREYLLTDPHQSYRILEASRAEVGLSLCREEACDALLLDFCLPDMDGLEFLEELKECRSLPLPPIIMLTGHGDEAIAVQAMKQGAQDYLVKHHLQANVLQRAVRHVVEQAHLQNLLTKTRERQRLIATTALRIRQSLDLEQILHTVVAEVRQLLGCDRVAVYQFLPEAGGRMVAALGEPCQAQPPGSSPEGDPWQRWAQEYCQNYQQAMVKPRENDLTQGCFNALESAICLAPAHHPEGMVQGKTTGTDNRLPLPLSSLSVSPFPQSTSNLVHILEQSTLSSSSLACQIGNLTSPNLVVPITLNATGDETSQLWGALIAHSCAEEQPWQPDDEAVLHELSVQLAIAIQQAELLAKTQTALKKEQDLNAFKSQIIATVSHEYRTPLAAILAAASTLTQHSDRLDATRQQRFLQLIEQKTRHMTKLVDDMLVVHQSELSQTKFKPFPLDMFQLVADMVEEQSQTMGDRCPLIVRQSGNSKNFWGDRGLLRLMLDNLLSNAIKYSPNGEPIEVRLAGKRTCITLAIIDKGIGIPSTEQENLFQAFSRGSNVGTIPGTGLGLAIAKTCVELHSGEISLTSKVGRGTKVTISLPKQVG